MVNISIQSEVKIGINLTSIQLFGNNTWQGYCKRNTIYRRIIIT